MKSRMPHWLWRRCDDRGTIPRWVHVLWPWAHFCPEFDGLLMEPPDWECEQQKCWCGLEAR